MKHKNKRPTDPETLALQAELKAAQSDLALACRTPLFRRWVPGS